MSPEACVYVRPASIAGRHFSTVIVGAGINGAGVFRDLSHQGIDCLIIDKGDVASGASSAPSRMIHGGLRYLEHGSFSLVAEATHERNLLLRNAPHLVRPLKTVVPLSNYFGGLLSSMFRFTGIAAPSKARGLFVVALGLLLYDFLGRRQRVMPSHRIERVTHADGSLFRSSVRWTATYFDAWISHPEWLIHELIADAHRDEPRSAAVNYCRAIGCTGKTLRLKDELTGEVVSVTADTIVNATGAWLDRSADALHGAGERVMGTKGSHLVLDHPELRDALAGRMAYFEASDGRVCIVYPFLGKVLVGSTDIPVDDPDRASTDPDEVDYLLGVLRDLFPSLDISAQQVVYTYVGVRPLARSTADDPGGIARDHSVVLDPPNVSRHIPLVCLVGGKWTTFRALAQQAADKVLAQLKHKRNGSTEGLPIGGGAAWPADEKAAQRIIDETAARTGLSPARVAELAERYGSQAHAMAEQFAAEGDRPLARTPGYSAAELTYLCRRTGIVHLSDLVLRRTLLAIRGQVSDASLAEVAEVAAKALGWDGARMRTEVQACALLLREQHRVLLSRSTTELRTTSPDAPLNPFIRPLPT
jgi:glycerol-3-phosphate dehydrogenase